MNKHEALKKIDFTIKEAFNLIRKGKKEAGYSLLSRNLKQLIEDIYNENNLIDNSIYEETIDEIFEKLDEKYDIEEFEYDKDKNKLKIVFNDISLYESEILEIVNKELSKIYNKIVVDYHTNKDEMIISL